MRVGIVALLQESNTFLHAPTTLEHFRQDVLLRGDEVRRLENSHHEIAGFFSGLKREGIDAVPIFAARAMPFGVITAEAFSTLLSLLFAEVERAGPLDGLLVAPHGATVSAAFPDADGAWLTQLRQRVGPQLPIVGTLDPHANLSPAMVAACQALTAYRTNPHLDQKARGEEAATLLARTLRGEIQPTQAGCFPPLAINIECQRTAEPPCLPLYEYVAGVRARPGVLAVSVLLGFPYADVAEMGSSILVVTDDDRGLAQQYANEIGVEMWRRREDFVGRLLSIDDALAQVATLPGPLCLLDMGDNVGGGSPGDGTLLAHALHQHQPGPAFVCLCDPEAVRQAEQAGVGATVPLRVGGKSDDRHGPPLEATFTVLDIRDGLFEEPQPRHGGFRHFDQGRTAVVRTATRLTLMLTSRRMVPFSLCQLTGLGVDPTAFHVLVAKGVQAPVAAYEPICKHLLRVNTPGVTTADLTQLPFHQRRRPMFPFERETTWAPA